MHKCRCVIISLSRCDDASPHKAWLLASLIMVAFFQIIFGTGVYAGVYLAQNYEIEKVEDPKVLFEKAQAFLKAKLSEVNDDSKKDK